MRKIADVMRKVAEVMRKIKIAKIMRKVAEVMYFLSDPGIPGVRVSLTNLLTLPCADLTDVTLAKVTSPDH